MYIQQYQATDKNEEMTLHPYSDFLDEDDDDSVFSHEEEAYLSDPSETDSDWWIFEESLELFLEETLSGNDRGEIAHLQSHTKTTEPKEEEDCAVSLAGSLRQSTVIKASSFTVLQGYSNRCSSVPYQSNNPSAIHKRVAC
jgi:hypothetical protein